MSAFSKHQVSNCFLWGGDAPYLSSDLPRDNSNRSTSDEHQIDSILIRGVINACKQLCIPEYIL